MRASRSALAATGALTCAAVALWVSCGATAFIDANDRGAYIGLLPSAWWLAALVCIALVLGLSVRPRATDVAPLWLSAVLVLPWLPIPAPLSVFVWTGAVRLWLWVAIAVAVVAPAVGRGLGGSRFWRLSPRHAAMVAGVVAALVYGAGAWIDAPEHPGGDEPHYLVITQSLIEDHDLQIENNHRQHDYLAYFNGPLRPDFLHRGANGEIYSIHAPGLPVLVAPVFALFGYPGVVITLLLVSALGGALVWLVAWRVTGDAAASWFGWASVALSAPFFLHASAVYPDGVAAVVVLAASLPLVDARARRPRAVLAIGAALACLPWLHTRFAVLAATAAAAIAGRLAAEPTRRLTRLAALAAFPLVSAALWLAYFRVIYGVFDPAAPYGGATNTSVANLVRGIPGLLFDQQFGLLANAPVLVCALLGFGSMLRRGPRRLAVELLAICAPYFLVVSVFYMWWGGFSAPARFLVPLCLLLGVPAAAWFSTRTTTGRVAGLAALHVSLAITGTMALVDRGGLSINVRDGASRLLDWLSPVVDLTTAAPSLFQNPPAVAATHAAIWIASATIAVTFAVTVDHWWRARGTPLTFAAAVLVFGLLAETGTMAAVSLVWQSNHALPQRPDAAGWALLHQYEPDSRQIAVAYRPFRRVHLRDLPGLARLTRPTSASGDEWSVMRHLPPGTYEVSGVVTAPGHGSVRVVMDSESAPIAVWPVASLGRVWTERFTIPVGVAALRVDADEAARRTVRDISVRAVAVLPFRNRLPGNPEAERVTHYGPATLFLLGGVAWIEPTGTWVGAGRGADFAIFPDAHAPIRLFLRNGPLRNQVSLESGAWHADVPLAPDEERVVDIPAARDTATTPLHVQAAHGVRPMDVEKDSQDQRVLGVWIETR